MARSDIEWTGFTWNPVTGCTKISPGCKNCYAEAMAIRLQAMGAPGYAQGFKLTLHPDRLAQPLRRRKPTLYFVNSMSDLFHEDVPDAFIDQVLDVCRRTPQHTYQVLTKRAERMAQYFATRACPPNVWLGVSVEDRRYGLPRVEVLRQIEAGVRFLSIEPLLEDLGTLSLARIHWVILGGESGPQARAMHRTWAERVCAQAQGQGVAFFFKQWGAWGPDGIRRAKLRNGRELLDRHWDAFPVALASQESPPLPIAQT